MTEGRFVCEFVRNVKDAYPGAFVRQHFTPPRGSGTRFLPETPYDFYVVYGGVHFGVEAKQMKGPSLPIGKYRPQQTKSLLEVSTKEAGGEGLYLVNVRELAVEKAPKRLRDCSRGGKVNCCLTLGPEDMACVVEDAVHAGRKSVRVEALSEIANSVAGRVKNAWDVKTLLCWVLGYK